MLQDKINAYMCLYTVLTELAKIAAPFVPFITEEIYQNLVTGIDPQAPESIHLCDYPKADMGLVDADLEKKMADTLKAIVLGRSCRNKAVIKNRQPIAKMFIQADFDLDDQFKALIMDELNIKEVVFTNDSKMFNQYRFKPELKSVGRKYGRYIPKISEALSKADGNTLMELFDAGGKYAFTVDANGQETAIELEFADVLYETSQKEGYMTDSDAGVTVVLETKLTDELIEEGFVREITSKIQTMRKEAGFEVQDRIVFGYSDNDKIGRTIAGNAAAIKDEILADRIMKDDLQGYVKEWDINGEKVVFSVEKI
jgi:isoleucyl-tRNA synthetase